MKTYQNNKSSVPRTILSAFLLLLCLALSSVALRAVLNDLTLHNRGVSWGDSQAAFRPDDEFVGINAALENEDQQTLDRGVALIKDGGYRWVRQAFPWREIERAKGTYDWQKWDRLVSSYSNAGLKIVARLDQPPEWSRKDNNWANRPPDSLDDYAEFVSAFVSHYKGKIDYIQVWDEPNIFPNWGNRPVDPAGYVDLLKAAYVSAKAANSDVKVLTAGLAPNTEKGGRNMADTLFLEAMYREGARDYFDILAAKPYGLRDSPEDRRVDQDVLNFSRVVLLREIMMNNGDDRKPVWAVEFGWNALPQGWNGQPSTWGQVSEKEQAVYTRGAIDRAKREWPWLGAMLVQGFGPQYAPSNPLYGFSVVDDAFQPRPVYESVKSAANYPYASPGRYSVDSKYVHYAGNWQPSENGKLGKAGDSLSLSFGGTRIDAFVWLSPAGGTAQVIVDGKSLNLSPQLDAVGRASLFSSYPHTAKITLASGLSDGEHQLELKVVEGQSGIRDGDVIVSGFSVVREAPLSRDQALIGLLLALQAGLIVWIGVGLRGFCTTVWSALQPLFIPLAEKTTSFERLVSQPRNEWIVLAMLLALAVFYFVSFIPIALAGLVVYALLTWVRPDLGLLFVVFTSPFYLLPKHFGSVEFSVAEILIVTCLVVFVLRAAITTFGDPLYATQRTDTRNDWLTALTSFDDFALPALLFVMAGLLSLLAAERVHDGLRELRTVVVEPIILYWLLTNVLDRRKVSWLMNALIVSALLLAVVGLYQYFFTSDVITAEGVRRAKAFFGSPNNLGLFLGRGLPIAICLGWLGGPSSRARAFYLGSAAVMMIAVALTFSVGAWIGVAGALVVILAFHSVWLSGLATAGSVGLAVVLPQVFRFERITSRLDFGQGTVALRLLIWQAAAKMIRDHPLLGVGLDNFLNQYPKYMLSEAWREPDLSHPHNLVLDYWLRTGVLGLAAGLWLIIRFFAVAVQLYHRSADVKIRVLALGLIGSMTDFVLHGMIDNSYFTIDLAIIFWTSLAAVKILEGEKEPA